VLLARQWSGFGGATDRCLAATLLRVPRSLVLTPLGVQVRRARRPAAPPAPAHRVPLLHRFEFTLLVVRRRLNLGALRWLRATNPLRLATWSPRCPVRR
jgi:hypothetical protein